MKVTLEGVEQVQKELKDFDKFISDKFWRNVKNDAFTNLERTAKPHMTGSPSKLERNIYSKQIDDGIEMGVRNEGMMVRSGAGSVNYASFVEFGTRPHIIKPNKKKSLRWVGSGGGFIFAKEVNHPGYKGSHFLENAANKTFKNLEKIWEQSK